MSDLHLKYPTLYDTHTTSSAHYLWANTHFLCFILSHTYLQRVTLMRRKGVFIYHLSFQEDVCTGIGSRNKVRKHPCFPCWKPCSDWWKMQCIFPGWDTNVNWRDAAYQWRSRSPFLPHGLTNQQAYQLAHIKYFLQSYWPQRMEVSHLGESSLTSRSHRVNPRSLLGPCFAVVVYVETWWPTLNVKLSYKPPSYWRILFWSRICPRQFIYLKIFRALVVPGGGCCKGIILQERQLNHRFYYSSPVISDKKRGYNRSTYPCTQTEE